MANQNCVTEDHSYNTYETPLTRRYASKEMSFNFSERKKIVTWRKLWLYLAKASQTLGIKISDVQISEMENNIENIDFKEANAEERLTKHDVVAHLRVFSKCCPLASGIIHLGATSCYLTDNADLIIIRDGLDILTPKILKCIKVLAEFCQTHKLQPTLGYTHFQPAQLTTVGKRACIWLSDLFTDFQNITTMRQNLRFRGCKGTVGTQASFLTLFKGDYDKVKELDWLVSKMASFESCFEITGQTYSRKTDVDIVMTLASFGCSVHKICTDIRLLCGLQEMREPFDQDNQVGSSAMPYKHNPIKSERCCGLSRHLSSLVTSIMATHSVQWLERTLDDSSNRRIVLPEAFLICDVILETLIYIFHGLTIYPAVINKNIDQELPFLSVETILIEMVANGIDRQECHERLRTLAHNSIDKIKSGTASSHCFFESIKGDDYFAPIHPILSDLLDPMRFIGCAAFQVDSYLEEINKILFENENNISEVVPNISI